MGREVIKIKNELDKIFKPLQIVQEATLAEQFSKVLDELEELDYALQCEGETEITQETIDVMRSVKGILDILETKHKIDISEALLENDESVTSRYAVAKRRGQWKK